MQQITFFDVCDPTPPAVCDLLSYDHHIVMFSGGKDSAALYLALRDADVPHAKIELWHHEIDGHEGTALMHWPCTPAYCRTFARAFDVPLYASWRAGGFARELLCDRAATAPIYFELPGGERGKLGTRRRFPQVSANLSVRWCSGALKIDVAAAALRNQPRFHHKRVLILSGERSASRRSSLPTRRRVSLLPCCKLPSALSER